MQNQWPIELDGAVYEISFEKRPNSAQCVLWVNGNREQVFPQKFLWNPNIRYCFQIGDHSLILVSAGAFCDLSVDGIFQTSGKPYQKSALSLGIVFQITYAIFFLAILFVPVILFHSVSIWFILAIPLTAAAMIATYRLNGAPFLSPQKKYTRPVIFVALMMLFLFLVILFGRGE